MEVLSTPAEQLVAVPSALHDAPANGTGHFGRSPCARCGHTARVGCFGGAVAGRSGRRGPTDRDLHRGRPGPRYRRRLPCGPKVGRSSATARRSPRLKRRLCGSPGPTSRVQPLQLPAVLAEGVYELRVAVQLGGNVEIGSAMFQVVSGGPDKGIAGTAGVVDVTQGPTAEKSWRNAESPGDRVLFGPAGCGSHHHLDGNNGRWRRLVRTL